MLSACIHLLFVIHILFWGYLWFGGLISPKHCDFILYYAIPMTYVIHILPFHVLENFKESLAGDDIARYRQFYGNVFPQSLIEFLKEKMSDSFQNPLSPQGMLILGFIINLYLRKYWWREDDVGQKSESRDSPDSIICSNYGSNGA